MYNIETIKNTVIHGDSEVELLNIPDKSIDCVIIDPPYNLLKHKLDRQFNRELIYKELYRVLKNNSFLVVFGSGLQLCKDIVMLNKIGFEVKENIVWVKENISNPMSNLPRRHELVYILVKGDRKINKCYNDYFYIAVSEYNLNKLKETYRRILEELNHKDHIEEIKLYLQNALKEYRHIVNTEKANRSIIGNYRKHCIGVGAIKSLKEGNKENTTMYIKEEDTIFKVNRERHFYQHETQKPLELMSRIVKLVSNENDIILDCFAGSGSTLLGAIKNDRNYIGIEIDKQYYDICCNRIKEHAGLFA